MVHILQFRRRLIVLGAFLLSTATSCVVPIGPDFKDPPASAKPDPNPPNFTMAMPAFESTVTLDSNTTSDFSVSVVDINGDKIWLRWVINYPPYTAGSTNDYKQETVVPSVAATISISCKDVLAAADRNLVVIASDKGFAASAGGDFRYHLQEDGTLATTISGWRLRGCL